MDHFKHDRFMIEPNMADYVSECPKGPMLHPLEEGHAKWASFLTDHIESRDLLTWSHPTKK